MKKLSNKSLLDKLAVLADAAKYDASCASSGSVRRDSSRSGGIGSTGGSGICHAYAPDGRCISLLKILLTNFCIYDCRFCINRVSSNVERARFSTDEVVRLTLDFYKRNYIEGLFLSSGIIRSEDYTMEQLAEVARSLREDFNFSGYIHIKAIAGASKDLLARAGRHADRLSVNIELPTDRGLTSYAPEKSGQQIRGSMAAVRWLIDDDRENRPSRHKRRKPNARRSVKTPVFAPGGQSTQLIVGADESTDATILDTSTRLYAGYRLKRVYYSAFSPIPDASSDLPLVTPPLVREHRLYQADWLLRFYGFERTEILAGARAGMLDLQVDPKLAWALQSRGLFPVDVNRADREMLLRVPGFGVRTVQRIVRSRRFGALRLDDVKKLAGSVKRSMPFICALDWSPGPLTDDLQLRDRLLDSTGKGQLAQPSAQLSLFG